jgi:hypothetical protein
MKLWRIWVSAALLGSTLACGGGAQGVAKAPDGSGGSARPQIDAEALFAREASAPLHAVPISVLEGMVTGSVEAASTPKIKSEENDAGALVSVVSIPIGTEEPVTCIFRQGRVDAGLAMGHMMAPVAKAEQIDGKPFAPEMSVMVAEGGVPILMAVAPFVEKGKPLLGKIAIAPRDHGTVLCTHFEAGYKQTFAKRVVQIVGAMKLANAPAEPVWREVRLLQKGSVVGLQERDIWKTDKAGQLAARTLFASFLEIEGHWVGLDGLSNETYEKKGGAVIEKTSALSVGGTAVIESKLTRKGSGEYAYEGKQKGEDLHGTFATKGPITSEASRAAQVRAWLSGHSTQTRFLSYDEMENAKGPIDVVYKRDASAGKVTVETRGAKVSSVRCTFDANGFCEDEADVEEDGSEKRLFVKGSL